MGNKESWNGLAVVTMYIWFLFFLFLYDVYVVCVKSNEVTVTSYFTKLVTVTVTSSFLAKGTGTRYFFSVTSKALAGPWLTYSKFGLVSTV